MIKTTDTTSEKILNSAKKEFLEKGFEKSSMRTIAKNANLTTGALYTRFKSKDDLFCNIVKDFANYLIDMNNSWNTLIFTDLDRGDVENTWKTATDYKKQMIDYIFKNYDIFLLLFQSSSGSSYEDFFDMLVDTEEREISRYFLELKKHGYNVKTFLKEDIHALAVGQKQAIFEIIRQKRPKQETIKAIDTIYEFYYFAWKNFAGI